MINYNRLTIIFIIAAILTGFSAPRVLAVKPSPTKQNIVRLPRPNSGTYTFKQAKSRVSEIFSLSPTGMLSDWEKPYRGFSIHVTHADEIVVYNSSLNFLFRNEGTMSLSELDELVEEYHKFMAGNPLAVLITSEIKPKQSATLKKIVKILFKPSIQIFYVKDA